MDKLNSIWRRNEKNGHLRAVIRFYCSLQRVRTSHGETQREQVNRLDRTGIRRFTEMADKGLLQSETIHCVPAVLNLMMR